MKVEEVLACSFSSWYEVFRKITTHSIIIPLPSRFLEYLHTDGVVLPESSTHGVLQKAENLAMDGDEDDPDIRDDELMKMYEDDWSTPGSDTARSQAPDLSLFESQIKEAIKTLGGRVFPKLNWSCPKDASWISFDKSLMCTCPCDIFLLLKSSEFVSHDLDMPFSGCDDVSEDHPVPAVSYDLVLRKWSPPHPASEFRCFVRDKRLVGLCQRNMEKYYANIGQEKDSIVNDVLKFHTKEIANLFPLNNYVLDVVRTSKSTVQLVDFNPWGSVTDSLLFEWDDLETPQEAQNNKQMPDFRYVTSEEGVKVSSRALYSLPQDVVDLAAGEDPFKLMDLMKLKIQKPGEGNSSSDEGDDEK